MEVFISTRFALMSLLSGIGRLQNTMTVVALLAAGIEAGYSPLQNSLLAGILFLTTALSALWKGRAVDRDGHGVVRLQALLALLAFSLLLLALLQLSWPLAFAAAGFLGLVRNNPGMLMQALWADMHKSSKLQARASAWENFLASVAQTAGPLLAALCIALGNGYWALAVAGFFASFSMLLWSFLSPDGQGRKQAEPSAALLRTIYPLVIVASLLAFAAGALQVDLLEVYGGERGALLVGVFTAGAAAASILYLLWRFPFSPPLVASLALLFPLLPLLSPFLYPALALAGVLFSSGTLAVNMLIKKWTRDGQRNEGFAIVFTGSFLGAAAGTSLAGVFLQFALPAWPLIIFSLLSACLGALSLRH